MFEIMALDQQRLIDFYENLLGWKVQLGPKGFGYIHFPPSPPANYSMLGGIGKAVAGVPGWEKGTAFYVQVESIDATLQNAVALGGSVVVPRVEADGYVFGMFHDPESNLIGLIEPFSS